MLPTPSRASIQTLCRFEEKWLNYKRSLGGSVELSEKILRYDLRWNGRLCIHTKHHSKVILTTRFSSHYWRSDFPAKDNWFAIINY